MGRRFDGRVLVGRLDHPSSSLGPGDCGHFPPRAGRLQSADLGSSTYLARYRNGAASMQLTENQSQQMMGSIVLITVKSDSQA